MMKLLIAVGDADYVEHLSRILAETYSDTFEVHVCSSPDRLRETLHGKRFDAALLEPKFVGDEDLSRIKLPLMLLGKDDRAGVAPYDMDWVEKYQRVSSIVSEILGKYAKVDPNAGLDRGERAHVTAVWSPKGGIGKTSVALAYAAWKVSQGKKTAYLSLQTFSDGAVYFPQTGKSISTIFGAESGSIDLLAQSIRLQDQGSGILYFCDPTNYDDISELTADDAENLVKGCGSGIDELIVDLSSEWNDKVSRVFDIADSVAAVLDEKENAKWKQFTSQHNVYGLIKDKLKEVVNRSTRSGKSSAETAVVLPYVQSDDPVVVYKTLSAYFA